MAIRWTHSLCRALLFAIIVTALVATGFGHRIASASELSQAEAIAFQLANATADDLCGDRAPGGRDGSDCLACQITGAADPTRPDLPQIALTPVPTAKPAPRGSMAPVLAQDPAHRPQGPPAA